VNTPLNPITVEVIRYAFIAASDEMKLNLTRTAHNPVIYEALDFSVAIFDRRYRMIAQSSGMAIFLGSLGTAIECVVEDIGAENLRPGDIYLFNDPYAQGNHLNDVTTVMPVFDGGELVAFTSTRAHWLDLGAKDTGGSIDCTDIVQEGLWFRSIRLYRAGELDESIWRIIRHNVRYAENMLGDLSAQVAASRTGERRALEIFSRHGRATVEAAIDEMVRQSEERAFASIRAMRDGVYEAEAFLDNDGVGNEPVPIRVRATVAGDRIHIDLTGTSPQVPGPINCGEPATLSACRTVVKALTGPNVPATEGDFAPLDLTVPEGCMFNARYPATSFMYGASLALLIDVLVRALGAATPNHMLAGHYATLHGLIIVGKDRDGSLYIQQEAQVGGCGASPDQDGESALIYVGTGDTRIIPAEIVEARYPLRLESFALRQDSAGAGRTRGGLGIVRRYRILGDEAFLTEITDRNVTPPWGMAGGRAAQPCRSVVQRPGEPPRLDRKPRMLRVPAGTLISAESGGGGGWGDPLQRDVEAVHRDVAAGYVSVEAALREYGVEIDSVSHEVVALHRRAA
jgi:N-methylhydantoinase B